ncbi:biosynthetic-type acetolactate synthase large subunit [Paenibacillus hamazuiensis]|uniref:biosynthetic-type acetolactate synthase large subunit n=1 Tax=Paenibacillus hamazuiensis TaxID=2936508 RepID=UPI00200D1C84|nr:biosynthetic-type acetolactate synthase large subunit [Paenibacillus hamazuiensis]
MRETRLDQNNRSAAKERLRQQLLKPDTVSGSEALLRSLLLEDVDCVFGYPGGAVLYIYDAMHGNDDFRHLLTRHEQGAIHAADGYARATGKTGVCLATSGPGATNLVTGIATAYMDSVPLVVITGNVATSLIGTDAFQEADIVGITMPITKHSYFVRDVNDLARTIKEAFYIAGTGRKGPVLVDIPKDVSAAYTVFRYPDTIDVRGYSPSLPLNREQAEDLLAAVTEAERPVILAGAGVVHANAADELVRLADALQIPVTTTLLGLGGFPSSHPLWMGMPGMHGTYTANNAVLQADLLISLGARFDDRVTMRLDGFAPHARIAHIDVDAAEIGKNVRTDFPVHGDIETVLRYLNDAAAAGSPAAAAAWSKPRQEWVNRIKQMAGTYPLTFSREPGELKPQYVIDMLSRTTRGDAIVTTDVGQHQMWVAQFYRFTRPRSIITSGGLGTMGFGFPAAIGAQIGRPDELVISVNGDGGMQMCAQELAICALHRIPVKIVVINNRSLGMIRQWQELIYDGRYSHIDLSGSPDFVKLAEAYGVAGFKAASEEEAERVWQEALAIQGPVLIDFIVAKNELVLPMIPQGKTLRDMILTREDLP